MRAAKELAPFTSAQLQELLPFVDELWVPAGTQLAQEGRLCHELVIVAEGRLEARGRKGSAQLGPGDAFGWDAMRDRGLNEATVVAATSAQLIVMSHQQFRAAEALALAARNAA